MSFAFDIHHIFTREMMGIYGRQIAELLQPGEFNPISPDSNVNKIARLRVAALSCGLQEAF